MKSNLEFGRLFRKYRLRSSFDTLYDLGDALTQVGLFYEYSLFSHWQKGDRIPKDRHILLTLINFFIKNGGIRTINEANKFLASTGLGYFTEEESKLIDSIFSKTTPLIQQLKKHDDIAELINITYEKIYEGYPYEVYSHLNKFRNIIQKSNLYSKSKLKDIFNHIEWIRLRCLSDITKTKDFSRSYKQAIAVLSYALEKNTNQIGPTYWMVSAIKRLEIITRPKKSFLNRQEVKECWDIGKLAVKYTSTNSLEEKISEHLELAKIALILKEKNNFYQQIDSAFYYADKLPLEKRYLKVMVWDVMARGSIGLKNDPLSAFEQINEAKKYTKIKYRAVNLYLKNTELQITESIIDPKYQKLSNKLKKEILMESSLLNNPYQNLRFKYKKYRGL